MSDMEKSREEILQELTDLREAYKALKEFYERDVVLLKDAEEQRHKSEEKFRNAFMTSPDSININRLSDGLCVSINEGFTKMLGYTEDEIIGKTSLEMNIWADPDRRTALVNELKEKGKVENFEARFKSKEGSYITGLMSASLTYIEGVPHLLNVTRDITMVRKAEETLESERNLLRTLIDNMPDRIYAKDTESRFIICNEALMKRMGKADFSEIIGKSDLELLSGELARQYYNNEQEIIRTGIPMYDHEETMGNISGKLRWSLATKVPIRDADGKITGIVGIGKDITERKRRELEVQVLTEISQGFTSTSNLDELLNLIHACLGKVAYAENCFIALYNSKTGLFSFPYFVDKFDEKPAPVSMGKSCSAYVFRTVKPFLYSQEAFIELQEKGEVELVGSPSPSWIGIPLQTSDRVIGVLVLQHHEEENVYSENDVAFLSSIGNQIAIAIERKKSEEEIILKNQLLETVNAEKDKFFSIIAHDLRGPLSAFVAATQILTEDIENMSVEEIKDIVDSMKSDASNVYTLLENLLEWSRLQRGVLEFRLERLMLNNLAEKAVTSVLGAAKSKGVDIYMNIPETVELKADGHMIQTVLRNLISNAVKFTPSGGNITISASIDSDSSVEIKVADTGIGMSEDMRKKLFIMNEKTNRPGTDGEPSSGLGLLLCKEFIEKHGGKISVESREGEGSCFSFTIPG
jgi:PAS domain S-box-containing protein